MEKKIVLHFDPQELINDIRQEQEDILNRLTADYSKTQDKEDKARIAAIWKEKNKLREDIHNQVFQAIGRASVNMFDCETNIYREGKTGMIVSHIQDGNVKLTVGVVYSLEKGYFSFHS